MAQKTYIKICIHEKIKKNRKKSYTKNNFLKFQLIKYFISLI